MAFRAVRTSAKKIQKKGRNTDFLWPFLLGFLLAFEASLVDRFESWAFRERFLGFWWKFLEVYSFQCWFNSGKICLYSLAACLFIDCWCFWGILLLFPVGHAGSVSKFRYSAATRESGLNSKQIEGRAPAKTNAQNLSV